jgi:hypothetical protein
MAEAADQGTSGSSLINSESGFALTAKEIAPQLANIENTGGDEGRSSSLA